MPATTCSTRAFDWFREVDAVFSTYKDDSEISRLNRDELALRECREDVRWVIARCRELAEETDGYFDAEAVVPGTIDPSGLVKGWSVDRAAALLDAAGAANYAVNAGGDIRLRGGALPARTLARRHPASADPRPDRGRRRGRRPRDRDVGRVRARSAHRRSAHGRAAAGPAVGHDHRARSRDRGRLRDRRVRDGRGRARMDAPAPAVRGDDDHGRRPRAVDARLSACARRARADIV